MNYSTKVNQNIQLLFHEIFHTLGLNHPDGRGTTGIMAYPPNNVNKNNINELIYNNVLTDVQR